MIKIKIPKDVEFILNTLNDHRYEAFIVGGCVRDSLLGRQPNDWDITTQASPEQIMKVFEGYQIIPTGLKHGTITIIINNVNYEITTYRIDGSYLDNRHPESVTFSQNIAHDLRRRDFTINAMAYHPKEGLIDLFGGQQDLAEKLIKTVGSPKERFQEDALRILRAYRFAAQLNFRVSTQIQLETITMYKLLNNISKERIREEFNKILLSESPSNIILDLLMLNVMLYIIPELYDCDNFSQHNSNHNKDILNHILSVVDNVEPKLELRLAALLHDIGKPNTFTLDDDGIGHFYGHHKESSRMCRDIMKRLKYSNKEIEYVSELIYYHMDRYEKLRSASTKKFINKVGVDKLDDLFKLFIADRVGSKPPYDFTDIYKLKFDCERILKEQQPLSVKDLDIDGMDLIKLGIPQGKIIGDTLKMLLNKVLENENLNTKDQLLEIIKLNIDSKELFLKEDSDDNDNQ